MALVIADRVKETTVSTGTGAVTLAGASAGYQSFSVVGNGNSTYYCIAALTGTEWEVGIGTYTAAGTSLSRDTVLASSNSGSLVNFSVGAKDVFVTPPAERSLLVQSAGTGLFAGAAAFTANGVPYANSTSTLATSSSLTFDGTNLGVGTASPSGKFHAQATNSGIYFDLTTAYTPKIIASGALSDLQIEAPGNGGVLVNKINGAASTFQWYNGASELMRLNNTGLGIGTSSPGAKLDVNGTGLVSSFGSNTVAETYVQVKNGTSTLYLGGSSSYNYVYGTASVPLTFWTNSAERMRLDSSGNLGLGVAPSAWASDWKVMQIGSRSAFAQYNSNASAVVTNNVYFAGTSGSSPTYIDTAAASFYQQVNGSHVWYNAPSGTAGSTISFTQAMTLDASGNLGIGTSSPGQKLVLAQSGATSVYQQFLNNSSSNVGYIGLTAGGDYVLQTNNAITFSTGASYTERMRLDSSGNLGLGVTPSAWLSGYAPVFENRGGTIIAPNTTQFQLFANAYLNSSVQWVRRNAGYAAYYNIGGGAHEWHIAGTSTAGSTISWTQAMTLDASGNLGIGTSSPVYKLQVASGATSTSAFFNSTAATAYGATGYNGGTARLQLVGGNASGATTGINFSNGGLFEAYFGGVQEAGGAAAFVWQGYSGSAYAERMRLDSSGNLGLGVTPSAWGSAYKAMQIGSLSGMSLMGYGGAAEFGNNFYFDTAYRYAASTSASRYTQSGGAHAWYIAPTGTAGNAITFTQAMTLDASGNLGIGTTSPAQSWTGGSAKVLQVQNASSAITVLRINDSAGTSGDLQLVSSASAEVGIYNFANGAMRFGTNGTERARIDSSGNFLIGGTAAQAKLNVITGLSGTYGSAAIWITDNATTSMLLNNTSSGVSSIWASGALTFGAGGNNNTEVGRFTPAGYFGVGTNAPVALLNVASGTNTTLSVPSGVVAQFKGSVVINSLNTGGAGDVDSLYFQKSHESGINIYNYNLGIIRSYTSNGYAGGLDFYTNKNTGGGSYASTFAMRMDENQRLGVNTNAPAAQLEVSIAASTSGEIARFTSPSYDSVYIAAGSSATNCGIGTLSSSAFNLFVNSSSRMLIDSTGRVGIGTSSPQYMLHVNGGSGSRCDVQVTYNALGTGNSNGAQFGIQSAGAYIWNFENSPLYFATNNTERARIDSSGNLMVGTTTTTNGALINWYKASGTIETSLGGITTAQNHIVFSNPNGNVGSIQVDGSATSYNTSSDYRLKNITGPITNSGAYIDSLNPVEGTWKADGSVFVGLIAHEVQEVSRTQVATGVKDGEEMQGMDYSNSEIIANLIAEIKSLRARVSQLESN